MTPDGTPIVGRTPLPNLFLNTEHGTLGWTMACGSARVLADQLSGRAPDIRSDDLSVYRYLRNNGSKLTFLVDATRKCDLMKLLDHSMGVPRGSRKPLGACESMAAT